MKTAESYQTYLDIQLNRSLSHSANGEKNTQNHLQFWTRKKQHQKGMGYEMLPVLASIHCTT